MDIEKIKKKNKWFTLVELIIVITILSILATIAFVSFQWHTKESRDVVRLTDLTNIDRWLELYNIKNSSLPMPDDYITIKVDWEVIWYQWDVWKSASRLIWLTWWKDPLDGSFYTYRISADKKSYQILWLWEINNKLSFLSTYASSDNSNRYPITKWKELWIILNKNKVPLQQVMTWSLDIATATWQYIWVKSSSNIVEWTWVVLKEINPDHFLKALWGKSADIGQHLLQDKDWNIYIWWYFSNDEINSNKVTDFEWNSLIWKWTSKNNNLFVIKLNSNLEQEWVKTAWWNWTIVMSKLLLDWNWNIYIWWYYSNDIGNNNKIKDFNWGDLKWVTNSITYDSFITKLDNSWNQLWIKTSWWTSSDSQSSNIWLDWNWNIYISWIFYNDKSNSNPTSFKDYWWNSITWVTENTWSWDVYVTKLNSLDWSKSWTKTLWSNKVDRTNQLYVATNWDVYVSWTFNDDLYNTNKSKDFNWNILYWRHTNASDQWFVAKLNTSWTQTFINVFWWNRWSALPNITIDWNWNVYVLWSYYNDVNNNLWVKDFSWNDLPWKSRTLDPTISWISWYSSFVAKLNSRLEQQWIKTMWWDRNDWAEQVYIDWGQNIYITWRYTNDIWNTNNVVDFAWHTMTWFTTSTWTYNVFLSKLSISDWTQQWIKKIWITSPFSSLILDKDLNVYVRWSFSVSSWIKDFLWNSVNSSLLTSSTDWYLARINSNWEQVFFKTVSWKWVDVIDWFAVNASSDLLLLCRYHNDFDDINLARDVLWYRLIWKSDSKAVSWTPDTYLQKILYKDLNK